jgi:hypothetical protein
VTPAYAPLVPRVRLVHCASRRRLGHDLGMRVAVLSDIHADLQALGRVLEAVDGARADEVWCLGDIVGLGGNEPAATSRRPSSRWCASARRSRLRATTTAG